MVAPPRSTTSTSLECVDAIGRRSSVAGEFRRPGDRCCAPDEEEFRGRGGSQSNRQAARPWALAKSVAPPARARFIGGPGTSSDRVLRGSSQHRHGLGKFGGGGQCPVDVAVCAQDVGQRDALRRSRYQVTAISWLRRPSVCRIPADSRPRGQHERGRRVTAYASTSSGGHPCLIA